MDWQPFTIQNWDPNAARLMNRKLSELASKLVRPIVDYFAIREKKVLFAAAVTWRPGRDGSILSVGQLTANITVTLDGAGLDSGARCRIRFTQNGAAAKTVTFVAGTGFTVSWGTAGFTAMGATLSKDTIYQFDYFGTQFDGTLVGTNF